MTVKTTGAIAIEFLKTQQQHIEEYLALLDSTLEQMRKELSLLEKHRDLTDEYLSALTTAKYYVEDSDIRKQVEDAVFQNKITKLFGETDTVNEGKHA